MLALLFVEEIDIIGSQVSDHTHIDKCYEVTEQDILREFRVGSRNSIEIVVAH